MQAVNNASHAIYDAGSTAAAYLAPAYRVCGGNNFTKAAQILWSGQKNVTFLDHNHVKVVEKVPLDFSERIGNATKEAWTGAGKIAAVTTTIVGSGCKLARTAGLVEAPKAFSYRHIAEKSFDIVAASAQVGVKTALTTGKAVVDQMVSHPKVAFAVAGTATSAYLAYQGVKDIAKVVTNASVVEHVQPGVDQEEAATVTIRKRTPKEKIKLAVRGTSKLALAGGVAYGTFATLAYGPKLVDSVEQKMTNGYNWAGTQASYINTQATNAYNQASDAFNQVREAAAPYVTGIHHF